ncbi:MAG: bifunctional UDP-3-O-[3-hydroxymyristoyl] N-acetylglucosamine deacetylase/3-hydroxyacyl-ACP dehydratase [Phycisphaeraceae bacterium]
MPGQQTIAQPASLSGPGLFHGRPANVTFKPAKPNYGIRFVRTDLGGIEIPALVTHVVRRPRRTALRSGDAVVETCEHVMSAIAALQIDNLVIEIDAPELPAIDGSAKPFYDVLKQAGIEASDQPRPELMVREPVIVRQDEAMVAALPPEHDDDDDMELVYELDYGPNNPIGRQVHRFSLRNGNYAEEIAPARTYVLEQEARALREAGLGTHLSEDDVLVIGDQGPLGHNGYRFDNEPVRHKILDLIGDLYLLGCPIRGRIIAHKSGHAMNHQLVRQLIKTHQAQVRADYGLHRSVFDIRKIHKFLPHRYPMLLVDRVIEVDGDRRAVGIKNVSINEPFFQGHYPGTPIMPGVLVVEAMAQLSGVLIGQKLEHTGKLAVLLSLDRVKLRKPVTPGDQLVMEAEAVKMRGRIVHMRCRAYVAEDLAAEAEVKFMLVEDEEGK